MKTVSLAELKKKHLGPIGSQNREAYEQELRVELLGLEIKRLRQEHKMTQEELGKLIGVQRAQISKLENGMSNLTIGTVMKLFSALNARVHFKVLSQEETSSL